MCEMHAFLVDGDRREMVMESVETVERVGGRIRLSNIFGEEKTIEAVFEAIRENKLFLAPPHA
jgi:predicted RNA-binding protein